MLELAGEVRSNVARVCTAVTCSQTTSIQHVELFGIRPEGFASPLRMRLMDTAHCTKSQPFGLRLVLP
jgi:hypothetical protein